MGLFTVKFGDHQGIGSEYFSDDIQTNILVYDSPDFPYELNELIIISDKPTIVINCIFYIDDYPLSTPTPSYTPTHQIEPELPHTSSSNWENEEHSTKKKKQEFFFKRECFIYCYSL